MTKIYYFSATGNSLWTAKKTAQIITSLNPAETCELLNIGVETQKKNCGSAVVIEADAVIFVFPSFAYGMPLVVRDFIKNAQINVKYTAGLVTYGSSPGGTLGSLMRILRKKGISRMYFKRIPAVQNYLAIFGTPKEKTIKLRCEMQKKATEEAARDIFEKKENKAGAFYPFSYLIYSLFTLGVKIFFNFYRVNNKCSGCAVCEKICPVSAIIIKNGRPHFTSKCEHCQGCINLCPLRAIQFGLIKHGAPGYCRPDIQICDLSRQIKQLP